MARYLASSYFSQRLLNYFYLKKEGRDQCPSNNVFFFRFLIERPFGHVDSQGTDIL